jgi:hypothetical protein
MSKIVDFFFEGFGVFKKPELKQHIHEADRCIDLEANIYMCICGRAIDENDKELKI